VLFFCTLLYLWMVGAAGRRRGRTTAFPAPRSDRARIGVLLAVAGLVVFADGAACTG